LVEADAGAVLVEGATAGFEPAEDGGVSAANSTVEQVSKVADTNPSR